MNLVRPTLKTKFKNLHNEFVNIKHRYESANPDDSVFFNWVCNDRIPRSIAAVLVDVIKDLLVEDYLTKKFPNLVKYNNNKIDVEASWLEMLNNFNQREMFVILNNIADEDDVIAKFESNRKYFNKVNKDCYYELYYKKSDILPMYSHFVIKTNYCNRYYGAAIAHGWDTAYNAIAKEIKQYTKDDNYDYLLK